MKTNAFLEKSVGEEMVKPTTTLHEEQRGGGQEITEFFCQTKNLSTIFK
jgi:hypothetical protein